MTQPRGLLWQRLGSIGTSVACGTQGKDYGQPDIRLNTGEVNPICGLSACLAVIWPPLSQPLLVGIFAASTTVLAAHVPAHAQSGEAVAKIAKGSRCASREPPRFGRPCEA